MSLALLLAVLLSCSSGAARDLRAGQPRIFEPMQRPIPVAVLAPPDVTASLVNRISAEADAMFASAGITFEWHRVASADAVPAGQLDVLIEDRRREAPAGATALGWITFTGNGADPSIHLSRAGADDLMLRLPGIAKATPASREIMLGRALGRALCHELGHYLLNSKTHTAGGLMRAVWPLEDFFEARRRLHLSSRERDVVARHAEDSPTDARQEPKSARRACAG